MYVALRYDVMSWVHFTSLVLCVKSWLGLTCFGLSCGCLVLSFDCFVLSSCVALSCGCLVMTRLILSCRTSCGRLVVLVLWLSCLVIFVFVLCRVVLSCPIFSRLASSLQYACLTLFFTLFCTLIG